MSIYGISPSDNFFERQYQINHFKESIHQELSKKQLQEEDYQALLHRLSEAQSKLPTETFHEEYGKVWTHYINDTVERLYQESFRESLSRQDKARLQEEIQTFEKEHRPSKENRIKINRAKEHLESRPIRHFDWISSRPPTFHSFIPIEECSPEDREQLLELASLIYRSEEKEILKKYHFLPEPIKQLLEKHLHFLQTTLFEDNLTTLQALFAAACDFMDGEPVFYPSEEEIHLFFQEEQELKEST